jgi:hypothetical protein
MRPSRSRSSRRSSARTYAPARPATRAAPGRGVSGRTVHPVPSRTRVRRTRARRDSGTPRPGHAAPRARRTRAGQDPSRRHPGTPPGPYRPGAHRTPGHAAARRRACPSQCTAARPCRASSGTGATRPNAGARPHNPRTFLRTHALWTSPCDSRRRPVRYPQVIHRNTPDGPLPTVRARLSPEVISACGASYGAPRRSTPPLSTACLRLVENPLRSNIRSNERTRYAAP